MFAYTPHRSLVARVLKRWLRDGTGLDETTRGMDQGNASKDHRHRILLVGNGATALAGEVLVREGYRVDLIDGVDASELGLTGQEVVISDVDQTEQEAVAVIRAIRRESRATPFILLATDPGVESATAAFDSRSFACVRKPVDDRELLHAVRRTAIQQRYVARAEATRENDRGLEQRFESALSSLWMAFQPIIDRGWGITGYEALLRTDEPSLKSPPDFLRAAADLDRSAELSERIWEKAIEPFVAEEPSAVLFMNIDPHQLMLDPLFPKGHPVRQLADRVVFEVRAQAFDLEDPMVMERLALLRQQGFRIAIDDLGAGTSGLASLALVEPDFVKIDSVLVRGVEVHARRQRLVQSIGALCEDLGIECIAMGVETRKEFESLTALDVDRYQGYFVGRPLPWGQAETPGS